MAASTAAPAKSAEPAAAATPASSSSSSSLPLVVVWDFDHSLIDDNSDTFVFDALAPAIKTEAMPKLRAQWMAAGRAAGQPAAACWTDLMRECLAQLSAVPGVTKDKLRTAMAAIPMHAGMEKAVRALDAAGAVQYILSDANSEFIPVILRARGLDHLFPAERIFTNPAAWTTAPVVHPAALATAATATTASTAATTAATSAFAATASATPAATPTERLDVQYYHTNTWCARCPPNLCKGSVLAQCILPRHSAAAGRRVLYVGDGGGDVCPALCLAATDHVFARKSWALHKALSGMQPADSKANGAAASTTAAAVTAKPATAPATFSQPPLRATLHAWTNGDDVLAVVQALLPHPSPASSAVATAAAPAL